MGMNILTKKIRINALCNSSPCARYRIQAPGILLNRDPEIEFRFFDHISNDNVAHFINEADIAIFQRVAYSPTLKYLYDELRARETTIVFEIDDALTMLPENSSFKTSLRESYEEEIKDAIKNADVVQCSTHALAQLYSPINPKCMVLENQLTHPKKPRQVLPQPHDTLVIGYGAAEHHYWDWMSIHTGIKKVVEKLENLEIPFEIWMIGDPDIQEAVPTKRIKRFPVSPFDKYLQLVQCFDVALMPLEDNPFNRCKSDIKYLEASSLGVACLASSVAYSNAVRHNETGLLYDTEEEFVENLMQLINNPELRNRLGKNAYDCVWKHRELSQHIATWANFYRTLVL